MYTWKVIQPFEADGHIDLICPHCGREARMPTNGHAGGLVIASNGVNLIMEPPGAKERRGFRPPIIECRKCHTAYVSNDPEDAELVANWIESLGLKSTEPKHVR